MRFGKVSGFVVASDNFLRLSVTLESGRGLRMVRDATVARLRSGDTSESLDWQADQYTQETIGVDLAEDGWEAIADELPAGEPVHGVGRSHIYTVRNLTWEGMT